MTSFIDEVISHLKSQNFDISELKFVLPNKRAGLFLKRSYAKTINRTAFTPTIISIEDFIADIAGLKYADSIQLIFMFYEVYKEHTPKNQIEPFENVMHWSRMLIQDFNNIDRYLIPQESIFDYLNAIKELDHWAKQENKSENIVNYLNFWKWLKTYYSEFKTKLVSEGIGYQGLVYREAVNNAEDFIQNNKGVNYIFAGFNALNKAEELILKKLLDNKIAQVYWDADSFYMNKKMHDAGLFLRAYKSSWTYYAKNKFLFTSSNLIEEKKINVISTPKNIGQVKYVGDLLEKIKNTEGNLNETAVVLADENLLLPLLSSLPENIGPLNITMGVPLQTIPLSNLFELLFKIHKTGNDQLYYRDVISILSHPVIKTMLGVSDYVASDSIIYTINKKNLTILSLEKILAICDEDVDVDVDDNKQLINLLFRPWNSVEVAIGNCLNLILLIKAKIDEAQSKDTLTLEFLYCFHQLFNALQNLHNAHSHMSSIASLHLVFSQLLKNETLDFQGEPLKGLQIMGMLETRVLDFKNVIILSVNESILPAGKSENSFIPFDVKRENGMPTYKELDAVYTYHFYRLLQRAQNIHILYNSEPDVLNGGEKSRFINQLEIESPHKINYITATSNIPITEIKGKRIHKSARVLDRIKAVAVKGFSPSSLSNYMRNPIDFYYQSILGIEELDEVEETVAANTMGTIIHDSLENLYEPFLNDYLTVEKLTQQKSNIEQVVAKFFERAYKDGQRTHGKNLIIFETCKHYVIKFISLEIKELKDGHKIKILNLEESFESKLKIEGIEYPVTLKGKVDRLDSFDGTKRIIDYKTGSVTQAQVEIVEWEDITTDYKKYSKSFQVLCYAYLLNAKQPIENIEAGIISFKNLRSGFLKFGQKAATRARIKDQLITKETLQLFEDELYKLIFEICNPDIDFIEKDV